jgi:hypothetical protein
VSARAVIQGGELFAVTDAKAGQAGAIVLWRLQGELDLAKLRRAWEAAKLPETLLPEYPSAAVALRRACREQEGKACVVHGLKDGGFAVVDVKAVEDADQPLDFTVGLTVKLATSSIEKPRGWKLSDALLGGPTPTLEFNHPENPRAGEISRAFLENLQRIEAEDTGLWLAHLVKTRVMAIPLRDTGGTYFVPQETLSEWQAIATATKAASGTFFAEIPAMQSSKAVEAILDALTREAAAQLALVEVELQKALASEKKGMGERAVVTRLRACAAMEDKLETYEALLDVRLDQVRERILGLRANLSAAALIGDRTEE